VDAWFLNRMIIVKDEQSALCQLREVIEEQRQGRILRR
jgi:hypothetical protein